jgi:uncharacterized protein with HEPN domain
MDFAAYEGEPMVRDAVEHRPGSIGEALNHAMQVEPELVDLIPELRQIVGLRNRVIHAYDAGDDQIVWDSVVNTLPLLHSRVAALLGAEEGDRK